MSAAAYGIGRPDPDRRGDMYAPDLYSPDLYSPDLVIGPVPALLGVFNHAGVLAPADVHTALRLARLAAEDDELVMLAAALAVRGPRVGHVSVDLADVRASAVVGDDDGGIDVGSLPWPDAEEWLRRVAASSLAGPADPTDAALVRPLRLSGSALYLDRYWRDEVDLATDLLARVALSSPAPAGVSPEDLARLFPGAGSADQRAAAAETAGRRLSVIAGGPGTGKTTTVARILALLCEEALAAGQRPPLVALAAPTGKAAARMEEAVKGEAVRLDTTDDVRDALGRLGGTTLHRLLGPRRGRSGQFRHHRTHRLPHEVVVVDEASMVSLSLMARLAEAVRPDARLILVGDPDQLVAVEAGAVLADIVGPAARPPGPSRSGGGTIGQSISILRTNHRFGGSLARLSEAVRAGAADSVVAILAAGEESTAWTDADPHELLDQGGGPEGGPLGVVADRSRRWGQAVRDAAGAGDGPGALAALRAHRLLCAHREGPAGVARWNRTVQDWVATADTGADPVPNRRWYPGRPVMVTANDYSLRLFNGDIGVAVASSEDPAALRVVFDDGSGGPGRVFSPSRLDSVETVFAMTVHKSQGSEFDDVTLVLPAAHSRLLTRELLYTALTRARRSIHVVATEAAVRAAVDRPIARASGLGARLWEAPPPD